LPEERERQLDGSSDDSPKSTETMSVWFSTDLPG